MSALWRRIAPLVVLVLAAGLLPLAAESRSFGLGVLRRDGILIPFASFNGRSWSADWPGLNSTELPISLSSIPKKWWGAPGPAAAWTAYLPDAESRPLALQKPAHLRVFCSTHLGLQTDYAGGPFDPRDPTIAKDGIAIAGAAQLQP